MNTPCSQNPELFFAGHTAHDDDSRGGPTLEVRNQASHDSRAARRICLLQCPAAQLRNCAQTALEGRESYGVWAGVQLAGGQTRKIPVIKVQREILAGIADGTIDPLKHPTNADICSPAAPVPLRSPRPQTLPLFPITARTA